jgi:hypothetical protein
MPYGSYQGMGGAQIDTDANPARMGIGGLSRFRNLQKSHAKRGSEKSD